MAWILQALSALRLLPAVANERHNAATDGVAVKSGEGAVNFTCARHPGERTGPVKANSARPLSR